MTTLGEFQNLKDFVHDARTHGFYFKHAHRGGPGIDICIESSVWTDAIDGTVVGYADTMEDAVLWVRGAMWTKQFLSIAEQLKRRTD